MSVHTFSLSPSLSKDLELADFIIINGLELEHFVEESLVDLEEKLIVSSTNVELLEYKIEDEEHHGNHDPHIWLSVKNALKQYFFSL